MKATVHCGSAFAALALCALPAAAQATTVSYANDSGLTVEAGAGESNNTGVSLESSGNPTYVVTESPHGSLAAAPVTAGPGCFIVSAQEVHCTRAGVAVVTVNAGDGDDFIRVGVNCAGDGIGDAFIDGGDGNDQLAGADGFDAIDGGAGNDTVTGCPGNDLLNGDAGDDFIQGNAGDDTVNGGTGNDRILNAADGVDVLSGGAGVDAVENGSVLDFGKKHNYSLDDVANDSDGTDTGENIRSDIENVTLFAGDNTRDILTGSPSANRLDGGSGDDTLSGGSPPTPPPIFKGSIAPVTIRLTSLVAPDDVLIGGPGDDTLNGDGGADQLTGGLGTDTLNGGADGDTILARDAINEPIDCGPGTDSADIDLRDAEPSNCENTDRGATKEGYNLGVPTRAVTRSNKRVGVRIACHRSVKRGCHGKLSVRSPNGKSTRYGLRRGKRRTVAVSLPSRVRRALARRHTVTVKLRSVERGSFGRKTTIRQLKVLLRR